jgi:DNA-binding NtrC family response regulator
MTHKKTILCVDDEHSLSIHRLMLETRGYRVLTAVSSDAALKLFDPARVDLVLGSAELPDAASGALAGHIKQVAPWVPVVLISGRVHFHTDAPADLLVKRGAVPPAQLLESIRQLLVKRRGPRRSLPTADGESAAC